jgi:predicted RNA binding protein YcfA (HicA-like mRNA interferase family)
MIKIKQGSYSVIPAEMKESLENDIMSKISKEIADEIDREVLNTLMGKMLENDGWHRVTVIQWTCISDEWCLKYINGDYKCYGHYWYFKESKDATFFTLKWK